MSTGPCSPRARAPLRSSSPYRQGEGDTPAQAPAAPLTEKPPSPYSGNQKTPGERHFPGSTEERVGLDRGDAPGKVPRMGTAADPDCPLQQTNCKIKTKEKQQ